MKRLKLLVVVATLLLAITSLCVCANAAIYSGTCGGEGDGTNLTWELDTEIGVLEIKGTGKMANLFYSSPVSWYSHRQSIKTVTLDEGVTSIGDYAFEDYYFLESVSMPNVTSIGEYAFKDCYSLASVSMPSVTSISDCAFANCDSLVSLDMPSVTSIGVKAFYYCNSLASVSMPSVTSIGEYAFEDCNSLASVSMPSVTSISEGAFYDCDSLASVKIPASVTSIDSYAFYWCFSLASITVDDANTNYSSDEYGVLFNKDKTTLIQYPIGNSRTEYTVPNSVTQIGFSAFKDCDFLVSVSMPSVTSISECAFENCTALISVSMPSVTSIGNFVFDSCTALTKVEIPEIVTSIGWGAFRYCTNLKKATIYSKTATFDGPYVFKSTHAYFKIYGYTESTAEAYANENGHTFVPLDGVVLGDADGNGEVNMRDITLVLQLIAGWEVDINEDAANADGNGEVNMRDITLMLQHIAGWDVGLG